MTKKALLASTKRRHGLALCGHRKNQSGVAEQTNGNDCSLVCSSVCSFVYQFVRILFGLFLCLLVFSSVYQLVRWFVLLFTGLFFHLLVSSFVYQLVRWFVFLFIGLFFHLLLCSFLYQFIGLFLCLLVCVRVCWFDSLVQWKRRFSQLLLGRPRSEQNSANSDLPLIAAYTAKGTYCSCTLWRIACDRLIVFPLRHAAEEEASRFHTRLCQGCVRSFSMLIFRVKQSYRSRRFCQMLSRLFWHMIFQM